METKTESGQSVKELLLQVETLLDEYEKKNGLNSINKSSDVDKYLCLTQERLKAMSPTELGEAAILLSQYAIFIQKLYNREITRVNWAESNIKRIIANEVNQYKGYSYEERKNQAIKGNDVASKLDKLKENCQSRVDRLSFVATRIEFSAKCLDSLRQTKRYNNVGQ